MQVASLRSTRAVVQAGKFVAFLFILGGFVAAIWLPSDLYLTIRRMRMSKGLDFILLERAGGTGFWAYVLATLPGFGAALFGLSLLILTKILETVAILADRLAPAATIVGESERGRGDGHRAPAADHGRPEEGSGEAPPAPSTRAEPLPAPDEPPISAEERARLRAQLDFSRDEPQIWRGHVVVPFVARGRRHFRALGKEFQSPEAALDFIDEVLDRPRI